jgi:hypothetical protein
MKFRSLAALAVAAGVALTPVLSAPAAQAQTTAPTRVSVPAQDYPTRMFTAQCGDFGILLKVYGLTWLRYNYGPKPPEGWQILVQVKPKGTTFLGGFSAPNVYAYISMDNKPGPATQILRWPSLGSPVTTLSHVWIGPNHTYALHVTAHWVPVGSCSLTVQLHDPA